MRVLCAPECFGPDLPAAEVAAAMARGWRAGAPHDLVLERPLSSGRSGLVALAAAEGGSSELHVVRGPDGLEVPVTVVRHGADVYLDAADVLGRGTIVGPPDPGRRGSGPLGELLAALAAQGGRPRRVLLGLGEVVTHDAGAGLLAVLGGGDPARLGRGGLALADLGGDDDLAGVVDRAQHALAGIELVLLTDEELPLLGLKGASATQAESRGATAQEAQDLERALGHLVDLVSRARPARTDLLTGRPQRLERLPGAGAGGGLGWAVLLLGGRVAPGLPVVADLVGLPDLVASSDLVLTGERVMDWRSLGGGVVTGVAGLAERHAVPCVLLAGEVLVGRRESMGAGMSATYALSEGYEPLPPAPELLGAVEARSARLARTWSPPPA